ncbi:MAG: hypothetical protein JWL91_2247, partial [Sphingomonas bacterium]|nr:hypothetical protein [Sphingomonas bacterium]
MRLRGAIIATAVITAALAAPAGIALAQALGGEAAALVRAKRQAALATAR